MLKLLVLLPTFFMMSCRGASEDRVFKRDVGPFLVKSGLSAENLRGELLVGSLCHLSAFTFSIPSDSDIANYRKALVLEPTNYDGRLVIMAGQDIGPYIEKSGFSTSVIVPGEFHGTKGGPMLPVTRQQLHPKVSAFGSGIPHVPYVFVDEENRKVLLFYFAGCAG